MGWVDNAKRFHCNDVWSNVPNNPFCLRSSRCFHVFPLSFQMNLVTTLPLQHHFLCCSMGILNWAWKSLSCVQQKGVDVWSCVSNVQISYIIIIQWTGNSLLYIIHVICCTLCQKWRCYNQGDNVFIIMETHQVIRRKKNPRFHQGLANGGGETQGIRFGVRLPF